MKNRSWAHGARLAERLLWLSASLLLGHAASAKEDFLPPEQAYRYSVRAGADRIFVSWDIEPGYYLYKKKMGVAAITPRVQLGEPAWPPGRSHTDEYFGTQEIYRGKITVPVPFNFTDAELQQVALELRLQGCADAGLCYPPLRWKTEVALPRAATPPPNESGGLRALLGAQPKANEDEFLPPDEAFRFAAAMERPDLVALTWVVADGYYLYKHRIQVTNHTPAVQVGKLSLPAGEPKHDEFFGDTEVYHGVLEASLPVARAADSIGTLQLDVTYQGCAESGLCYNPITKSVELDLPPTSVATSLPLDADAPAATDPPMIAEQDRLATALQGDNLLYALLLFFAAGLLLSLTPCVLPMIPILSGIIVGQGEHVTRARSFSLAFTYVQGMALTYAAAGALFVLTFKQAPQAFFQQPWIITLMVLLFVALALAMFGFYTLQLPGALQTRLTDASNRQKSGTYVGTFVMGALSALVVTACVAPAIIAALSVISQSRQILRGAAALYATGLGMGVPLLIVGASAGNLLPKAGPWMDTIKSLFGVVFLGVAIYLATPLLPDTLTMLLWAALTMLSGFWIFSLQGRDGGPLPAAVRGTGLIAVVYGVLLLIGAASGSRDPLQPLDRLSARVSAEGATQHGLAFQRIKTVAELDRVIANAAAAGKPLMLDFYADWCVACKEMEKYTFTDAAVQAALANVVLLQADVTANDDDDKALLARFEIFGPPTIAFFGMDGVERRNFRLVGFTPAPRFSAHVKAAFAS